MAIHYSEGDEMGTKLLSVTEAADRLHISVCTLRSLRQEGRFLPATKIGRRIFWDEADLEDWLRRQKEAS